MPLKKRRAGRPFGGRLDLDPRRVEQLPDSGSILQFRRILGVSHITMHLWRETEGMPVRKDDFKQKYTIKRDEFIEWAKTTGRIK